MQLLIGGLCHLLEKVGGHRCRLALGKDSAVWRVHNESKRWRKKEEEEQSTQWIRTALKRAMLFLYALISTASDPSLTRKKSPLGNFTRRDRKKKKKHKKLKLICVNAKANVFRGKSRKWFIYVGFKITDIWKLQLLFDFAAKIDLRQVALRAEWVTAVDTDT